MGQLQQRSVRPFEDLTCAVCLLIIKGQDTVIQVGH